MNALDRFNVWYDKLENPKRFIYFIVPMSISLVLLNIPKTIFFGALGLSLMGGVASYRAMGKRGGHFLLGIALAACLFLILTASTIVQFFGS